MLRSLSLSLSLASPAVLIVIECFCDMTNMLEYLSFDQFGCHNKRLALFWKWSAAYLRHTLRALSQNTCFYSLGMEFLRMPRLPIVLLLFCVLQIGLSNINQHSLIVKRAKKSQNQKTVENDKLWFTMRYSKRHKTKQ